MPDAISGTLLVVSAIAGVSSSQQAAASQDKVTRQAKKTLDFQQGELDDWEEIYGGIEENLGEFYGNLTPEYVTTQGLEAQQKAYQEHVTGLTEQFARSGLTTGAQGDILARSALEDAKAKAAIRVEAPYKVAEEQKSFLSLGTAQGAQAKQGVVQGYQGVGQAYQAEADIASQEAADAFSAAGSYATTLGTSTGLEEDATTAPIN